MNISIICRRKRNKFIKIIIIFARTQPKALDWAPPVGTPFYLQPEQFLQFPVQDEGFLPRGDLALLVVGEEPDGLLDTILK